MRKSVALMVAVVLVGCAKKETVYEPVETNVETVRWVPIRDDLVDEHPVATGRLRVLPVTAASLESELIQCNADKRAIKRIRGTVVEPDDLRAAICGPQPAPVGPPENPPP